MHIFIYLPYVLQQKEKLSFSLHFSQEHYKVEAVSSHLDLPYHDFSKFFGKIQFVNISQSYFKIL